MCSKSGAKTYKIGTLGKSHNLYETTEKMKMAKQATTKTSFVAQSGSKRSVLWWQPSYENTKEIMMRMTKTHFSTFNRLNSHFQSIHSISVVVYSYGFWLTLYVIYAYYSTDY